MQYLENRLELNFCFFILPDLEVLVDSSNEQYTIYNTTNAVNNVTVSMWLLVRGINSTRPSFTISTSEIDELQISFESVPYVTING